MTRELPFPKSLPEFQKLFPDDAHCAAYMERVRWPDGFGDGIQDSLEGCWKCQAHTALYGYGKVPRVTRGGREP